MYKSPDDMQVHCADWEIEKNEVTTRLLICTGDSISVNVRSPSTRNHVLQQKKSAVLLEENVKEKEETAKGATLSLQRKKTSKENMRKKQKKRKYQSTAGRKRNAKVLLEYGGDDEEVEGPSTTVNTSKRIRQSYPPVSFEGIVAGDPLAGCKLAVRVAESGNTLAIMAQMSQSSMEALTNTVKLLSPAKS